MRELVKMFEENAGRAIDEAGIYPHSGLVLDRDGKLVLNALATPPGHVVDWFWNQVCVLEAKEVMFGLDMTTKPGQGTEFADVLTCVHWREGGRQNLGDLLPCRGY